MAYERVTGIFGPERLDILHGIQTAALVNVQRTKGRKADPKDYIPVWDQGPRGPMSWQDMLAAAKAYTGRVGGTDHTTKGGARGDA
ncbi:hypothetical protein TPA0906_34840 [Streptomyces olivaceus]|nr:hypothetical protein [Streptomyces olivaceus]GHJ01619.1 hypothetical protein TPA0906_34840 [Streptomyces olivaceus]